MERESISEALYFTRSYMEDLKRLTRSQLKCLSKFVEEASNAPAERYPSH